MLRRAWVGGLFLLAGGCASGPESTSTVSCDPFLTKAHKPPEVRHVVETPGSKEAADRVFAVGGAVIAANQQIGFRPRLVTIGDPKEDIFHRGTRDIFITEGLVRRCTTDGELAAVLCMELGKMVAEREAYADPVSRQLADRAPIEMPVGTDFGGSFGPPDGTRRMELSKYVEQPRRKAELSPPPSPESLACEYLRKAGYSPNLLDEGRGAAVPERPAAP